jgi:L-aspartate oxidase
LAIDQQGEWSAVFAKSVVLVVGGGGALYPATTNVPSALGEGYVLAFEAGLALRDMEFIQFVAGECRFAAVSKGRHGIVS